MSGDLEKKQDPVNLKLYNKGNLVNHYAIWAFIMIVNPDLKDYGEERRKNRL